MKKNSFATLISIIVIVVMGVVGYFTYKNLLAEQKSSTTISDKATEKLVGKVVINVKSDVGAESVGTMVIPSDWQVTTSDNKFGTITDAVFKSVKITKGNYSIQINSYDTGRSSCMFQDQLTGEIRTGDVIAFSDKSGYQYLREKPTKDSSSNLDICSNGSDGKLRAGFANDNAIFGQINYENPQNPDIKILNEMDNIVASFKAN